MIKASQLKFMQRMLLFIVLTSTVVLTSCRKEGCTDTIAENYTADAEDEDGSCTYYSDKFIGGYDVSESCSVGTTVFSIVVNESDNGKEYIVISNFGDYGVNITAEVIGNNIKFNCRINVDNYILGNGWCFY